MLQKMKCHREDGFLRAVCINIFCIMTALYLGKRVLHSMQILKAIWEFFPGSNTGNEVAETVSAVEVFNRPWGWT
jgi:hypothetical protein